MKDIAFDIETLRNCFCICALDTDWNKYEYVVSGEDKVDPRKIRIMLDSFSKYDRVATYNGAAFDLRVLAWIAEQNQPLTPKEISEQATLLINDMNAKCGQKTSKCWKAKTDRYRKNHIDVLKVYTGCHSLKWWELARGWSVKETDVAWDKPFLTKEEVDGTVYYCHHDVEATLKLFMEKDCQELIEARNWLIEKCETRILPDAPMASLSETYTYGIENVEEVGTCEELIDWYSFDIPTPLLDKFMALARGDIDGFFWNGGSGQIVVSGSEEYKGILKATHDPEYFKRGWAAFGKGGAHYARAGLNLDTKIFDVASLYPSIIQHHLPLKTNKAQKRYVDGKLERIRIKRLKGTPEYKKPVDLGLKLNLNSLSGKFRQQGAIAYAPNHGLAMCIIGQLLISEATWNAIGKNPKEWENVVEINTDSFAVVGAENIRRAREYVVRCLDSHKFEFEEDDFPRSYWKDVNHYVVFKEDGSIKETHGDEEMGSEPVIINSIYDMARKLGTADEPDEPYLVETDNWKDYLVKFMKGAGLKNARIGNDKMTKKYYYFLWVTNDCPDAQHIYTNSNEDDRKTGVYGFSPEDLEKYAKYIDKEQYMDDLRKMCKVWRMDKLARPPVKVKKLNMAFEVDGGLF